MSKKKSQTPEILGVDISLDGFTSSELKDILAHISKIENYRTDRFIFVRIRVDPNLSAEKATEIVKDLWPREKPVIKVLRSPCDVAA